jgi:hypothetical protein
VRSRTDDYWDIEDELRHYKKMEIESYLGFGAFNMKAKWRTAVKAVAFFLLIVLG